MQTILKKTLFIVMAVATLLFAGSSYTFAEEIVDTPENAAEQEVIEETSEDSEETQEHGESADNADTNEDTQDSVTVIEDIQNENGNQEADNSTPQEDADTKESTEFLTDDTTENANSVQDTTNTPEGPEDQENLTAPLTVIPDLTMPCTLSGGTHMFAFETDTTRPILYSHNQEYHFGLTSPLDAGKYTIVAQSYDGYEGRDTEGAQRNESWYIEIVLEDGSTITTTNTTDIDDGVMLDSTITEIASSLDTNGLAITSFVLRHADAINGNGPDSVRPACVSFDFEEVETPEVFLAPCTLTSSANTTIFEFGTEDYRPVLFSHGLRHPEIEVITADLEAGTYVVTAQSYDGYEGRQLGGAQRNERWFVEATLSDDSIVATDLTEDIADGVSQARTETVLATEFGNTSYGITSFTLRHADVQNAEGAHSVRPICVSFEKVVNDAQDDDTSGSGGSGGGSGGGDNLDDTNTTGNGSGSGTSSTSSSSGGGGRRRRCNDESALNFGERGRCQFAEDSESTDSDDGEILGAFLGADQCPVLENHLYRGSAGNEVRQLQHMLNLALDIDLEVDGVFGPKTEVAVVIFQYVHKDLILVPYGDAIDGPTGYVGDLTLATLNALLGCNGGPLTIFCPKTHTETVHVPAISFPASMLLDPDEAILLFE